MRASSVAAWLSLSSAALAVDTLGKQSAPPPPLLLFLRARAKQPSPQPRSYRQLIKENQTVDLGYAKYQGRTLGNGVNQWLSVRFAAPSVPPRRFAAAQPPLNETEVQDATREGALCLAANKPEGFQFGSSRQFMAEDCLFAGVYAPADATASSKLPVVLFVGGGGFSSNSNGNFNGTGLVEASGMGVVVVRANYRVGILGFVAGTLVEADTKGAVSNNGLKDIAAAARWVKQNIAPFGGDPDHVVLMGDSSGGNAVDDLLAANNGTGFPDLFVGAIAESTGWGAEGYTTDRDKALQNNIRSTGCDAAADPVDCLRNLPIGELQARTTTDGWGPTVDGTFIAAPHYQMYEQGRFQNIPVIYGYASDEATPDFISNQTINTTAELAGNVRSAVGASATDDEISAVLAAYPDSLNNVSFFGRDVRPRNASLRAGPGRQWQRGAAIKTELKLHCVGAFFSDMFAAGGQAHNYAYRYNVLDETPGGNADKGLFSPHTSELYATWGRNNTDGGDPGCLSLDASDPLSCVPGAKITQAYWLSFIRTLNPNTLRLAGAPEWTPWSVASPNRIVLDNKNATMEQMGQAVGEVPLAGMNQRQRCLSMTLNLSKRIIEGLGANQTLPAFANGTRTDPTLAVLKKGSGVTNGAAQGSGTSGSGSGNKTSPSASASSGGTKPNASTTTSGTTPVVTGSATSIVPLTISYLAALVFAVCLASI